MLVFLWIFELGFSVTTMDNQPLLQHSNINICILQKNTCDIYITRVIVTNTLLEWAVSNKTDTKWNGSTNCGTAPQKCGTAPQEEWNRC